jgi:hypothetical protein
MKVAGVVALCVGLVWGAFALGMDTTVTKAKAV